MVPSLTKHPLDVLRRSRQSRVWRRTVRRFSSLVLLVSGLGGGVLSLAGCSGDTLNGPPSVDAAHAYWALQIQQPHAINLALNAPYDTVRLTAIPRTVLGTPLTDLGPVTWTAGLDSSVRVDSTGLVTAQRVTSQTTVVASVRDAQHGLTLNDVVFIQVTATAPPLPFQTFSMQPTPGDSATREFNQQLSPFSWTVRAVDADHNTVCDTTGCGLLVLYNSSDYRIVVPENIRSAVNNQTPPIATNVQDPALTGRLLQNTFSRQQLGSVYLTATTLAYGSVLRDSVLVTITPATYWWIIPEMAVINDTTFRPLAFQVPLSLTLGAGAVVQWSSWTSAITTAFDVQFDNPRAADTASCLTFNENALALLFGLPSAVSPTGGGNITPFGNDTTGFHGVHNMQYTLNADGNVVVNVTSYQNDCRARRFATPGVYHWRSSLFPHDTFTLTIVPHGH